MKYLIVPEFYFQGNHGPGGWGAVILDEEKNETNISGEENLDSRIELVAPIMALKKIKKNSKIIKILGKQFILKMVLQLG